MLMMSEFVVMKCAQHNRCSGAKNTAFVFNTGQEVWVSAGNDGKLFNVFFLLFFLLIKSHVTFCLVASTFFFICFWPDRRYLRQTLNKTTMHFSVMLRTRDVIKKPLAKARRHSRCHPPLCTFYFLFCRSTPFDDDRRLHNQKHVRWLRSHEALWFSSSIHCKICCSTDVRRKLSAPCVLLTLCSVRYQRARSHSLETMDCCHLPHARRAGSMRIRK